MMQNEEKCINAALQITFPAGILPAILQYLNLNEVMSLYLTCNYFCDMEVMHFEINKRLEQNNYNAFRVAVKEADINLVKNCCKFVRDDPKLISKLLTTGVPNAFKISIAVNCSDIFKLIVNLIGNDDDLRWELLTTDGVKPLYPKHYFCKAAKKGHVEILKFLWALSKDFDGLKEDFLTTEDYFPLDRNVFVISGKAGRTNVMRLLWGFADEIEGIKEKWFAKYVHNMFCYAVKHNEMDVLRLLLLFLQELDGLENRNVVTGLFECAVTNLSHEAVSAIINFVGDDDALKKELLTFKMSNKECPFRVAVIWGHIEILELLCKFVGGDKYLKREVLAFNDFGALVVPSFNGAVDVLKLLCEFVGDDETLKEVLLTTDGCSVVFDCVAFVRAAECGHVDALQILWEFAGNDDNLKRRLLNSDAFDCAAEKGHVEALKLLWQFAGSYEGSRRELLIGNVYWRICWPEELEQLNEEEKNCLMLKFADVRRYLRRKTLTSGSDRYRAFCLAAKEGCVEALKLLWQFAANYEGLKRRIFVFEAFANAAEEGHVDVLELLWQFAGNYEGLERALLASDAFSDAASAGHVDVLELLWQFAGSYEGVRRELLTSDIRWYFCREEEDGILLLKFADNHKGVIIAKQMNYDFYWEEEEEEEEGGGVLLLKLADRRVHLREKDGFLIREALTFNKCNAFCRAAKEGRVDVLKLLWQFAGNNDEERPDVLDKKFKDVEEFKKLFLENAAVSHADVRNRMNFFQHAPASQEDVGKNDEASSNSALCSSI